MDCECGINQTKRHKVIRNFQAAGEYDLCGMCGKMEWLWMLDELETEICETPNHFFLIGAQNGCA